ncbi:MAG: glycoside hydrolase [Bacteroidales bacterium]|nr:glycoside hydrolase [Bacteroidales bacterium]
MKKLTTRRSFLTTNFQIGLGTVTGSIFFQGVLNDAVPINNITLPLQKKQIWSVRKELYVPSPEPRVGISLSVNYVGKGLKREEIRAIIRSSDWTEKPHRRISPDNGRSWSDWEIIDEKTMVQGDCTMEGGENQRGTGPFDPVSKRVIKPVFQRIIKGKPEVAMSEIWKGNRLFCDHGFYQLSSDDGLSWGKAYMLKYEEGPDFDPDNWAEEKFYRTNEMYIGNALVLKNGSVIITATVPVPFMDEEDKNIPSVFPNNYREGCVGGAVCFIGHWNKILQNYDWKVSKPLFLPRRISTRGLNELHITELTDGRLLMIIRGSNTGLDPVSCPGRKWYSVSEDGGCTWNEIKDIRYDTGEQFYSPASISSTIRSSLNGKLYWIGNISDHPVDGNSPRYPLYIVEIDEEQICFRKKTLTIIDDRDPAYDSESLQLSNFSIFENRETKEIEIYLTRLGEQGGGADIWTANAYKYTLRLQTEK